MKQFMEQINDSLLEAARIDGASEFHIFLADCDAQCKACLAHINHSVFSITVE